MKPMTDSMSELVRILALHSQKYPLMEPTDAVKLIYQNEFGGGHLIRDEAACLGYLQREYEALSPDAHMPLYESIGNGLVRVNLVALPESQLPWLGQAFIQCAGNYVGDLDRFLEKLEILREQTAKGMFSFTPRALEEYLQLYAQAGYPAVSHSQTYRQAYHPAYRVLQESVLRLQPEI